MGIKNIFNAVKLVKPKRNTFNLTHDVKQSMKMGELTPVLAAEAIPGDTWHIGADSLVRFQPILAPIMHRVDVTIHYFFVPNRILWPNYKKFVVGDTSVPTATRVPYFTVNSGISADQKRFLDYFGIPPITGPAIHEINALPFAAYQMIYNEYYRDQDLINPVSYELVDGDNGGNLDLLVMRNRSYEHDYFTAARPNTQKGDPVMIPVGEITLMDGGWDTAGTRPKWVNDAGSTNIPSGGASINLLNGGPNGPWIQDNLGAGIAYDPNGTLQTEPVTIESFRLALRIQEFFERLSVAGSRFKEYIKAVFGVDVKDERIHIPEYITGVKTPVVVSEVLNATGISEYYDGDAGQVRQTGSPQGTMTGHAVSVSGGNVGHFYVPEPGYIIGIMSVVPKTAYQQGIPKTYLKREMFDFAIPSMAHLGEQAVLQAEIYADDPNPNDTFGYLPRYAEYKYLPGRVVGDFRTTLDYWHLGRKFSSPPTLSQDFIECRPDDVKRVFAVQDDTDNILAHIVHKLVVERPLPLFGQPMIQTP